MEILFVLIIKIYLLKRVPVKRNKYGREEEKYVCEDCSNCPFKNQCHKSKENRVITVNEELTSYHKEVIDNLECIHGTLLRIIDLFNQREPLELLKKIESIKE